MAYCAIVLCAVWNKMYKQRPCVRRSPRIALDLQTVRHVPNTDLKYKQQLVKNLPEFEFFTALMCTRIKHSNRFG